MTQHRHMQNQGKSAFDSIAQGGDAVALAFASNMTATDLDVSEIAVARHRCQTDVRSHI